MIPLPPPGSRAELVCVLVLVAVSTTAVVGVLVFATIGFLHTFVR